MKSIILQLCAFSFGRSSWPVLAATNGMSRLMLMLGWHRNKWAAMEGHVEILMAINSSSSSSSSAPSSASTKLSVERARQVERATLASHWIASLKCRRSCVAVVALIAMLSCWLAERLKISGDPLELELAAVAAKHQRSAIRADSGHSICVH